MLEGAIGSGETPTLAALAARGSYRRATSVFPVADARLPLVDRDRRPRRHPRDPASRLVRPARAAARRVRQLVRSGPRGRDRPDAARHARQHEPAAPRAGARTLFESLADAGLRTAAVNFTAYRGRTPHRSSLPLLGDVMGPERFFFYNLFSSDRTGAPLSWRNRPAGSIDAYAAAVGRWLVTRGRLRLPRLLPLRLRLRLARARPRHRARDAAALRRRDRLARRGRRRGGCIPRALLGGRDGRSRADAACTRRSRSPRSTRASKASCRSAPTAPPTSTSCRAAGSTRGRSRPDSTG